MVHFPLTDESYVLMVFINDYVHGSVKLESLILFPLPLVFGIKGTSF